MVFYSRKKYNNIKIVATHAVDDVAPQKENTIKYFEKIKIHSQIKLDEKAMRCTLYNHDIHCIYIS